MAYAYGRLMNAEEGNWGEYTEAAIKIRDAICSPARHRLNGYILPWECPGTGR